MDSRFQNQITPFQSQNGFLDRVSGFWDFMHGGLGFFIGMSPDRETGVAAPTFLCLDKEKSPQQRWKRNRLVPNLHPPGTSWGVRTAASQVCADLPCFIQARCSGFSASAYAAYWNVGYSTGDENELALLLFPLPLRWILRERSGSGKKSENQFVEHPG